MYKMNEVIEKFDKAAAYGCPLLEQLILVELVI